MKKIPILVDTDLGDDVDDAAAIIMAARSPEIKIEGITTVFHDTEKRAEMVLELLELCEVKNVPVYAGCGDGFLNYSEKKEEPIQYRIMRRSYKENIQRDLTAAQFILQKVKDIPDLIVVEMGMMTNLAIAFLLDPKTMRKAKIIAMGGIFSDPLPEWNIKCDAVAAKIVMERATHLKMFGLDVTKYLQLSSEELDRLERKGSGIIQYYKAGVNVFQQKTGFPITLHDVILIAYLLRPDVVQMEQCDYTVEPFGNLTAGGIVKKIDGYALSQTCSKDFYFARSVDLTLFNQLIKERIY